MADDLTTQAGLDKALAAVSDPNVPTLLFDALPCTGGSPYQHINWKLGAKTRAKIRQHRAIFRVLWRNFVRVADACLANGGRIAIEWPRACTYWHDRKVKAAMRKWGLETHRFDGCRYNLRSQVAATRGKLLRKPWSIASNCEDMWRIALPCNGLHEHTRTQGQDTRLTEGYTDELVDQIHACWWHTVLRISTA